VGPIGSRRRPTAEELYALYQKGRLSANSIRNLYEEDYEAVMGAHLRFQLLMRRQASWLILASGFTAGVNTVLMFELVRGILSSRESFVWSLFAIPILMAAILSAYGFRRSLAWWHRCDRKIRDELARQVMET
jgi:hypothetical protein